MKTTNQTHYRGFVFSIICSLVFFQSAIATTYYVSPEGQNGNLGTQESPFFLIQDAIDLCTSGNDTIFLEEGTYWQRPVFSEKSGIYLSSINPLNKSTLSGSGVEELEIIYIENCDSISIANLILREKFIQDAKAIYALGEGDGLFIFDCELFNIGWTDDFFANPEETNPFGQAHGILINGRSEAGYRNVYVGRNELSFINLGNSEGLTLTGNVFDFLIEQNLIYNLTNIGIDIAGHYSWAFPPEGDQNLNQARSGRIRNNEIFNCRRINPGNEPAAIYVDGGKDVIIDNNTVYQNGTGISAGCENPDFSAENVTITHNLILSNDKFGTVFGANAGVLENSVCRNNTYFNNGILLDNSGSISLQKSNNSSIRNNIIYISSEDYFGLSMFGFLVNNLEIDHNLFYSPDGNTARVFAYNPAAGSSETDEDPIFIDPLLQSIDLVDLNLHLTSSSPAIDAGSQNIALIPDERDMDGTLVSVSGIDIGAYSWDSPTLFNNFHSNPFSVYPNPCGEKLFISGKLLKGSEIVVTNLRGQVIFESLAAELYTLVLQTEKLEKGLYFIQVRSSESISNMPFVKL
ncbi:MAG: right-handed parallel beta-helix repeat-containing protein [Bacteroidia bacterium]